MSQSKAKHNRVMEMYFRLRRGEVLRKNAVAEYYGINERSVQRDIEDLRCILAEQIPPREIIYDRKRGGYRLEQGGGDFLSNSEILAVCKILLESRSMMKAEMLPVIDKLIACAVPESHQHSVRELVANEKFHYIEPHHGEKLLDSFWALGQAVSNQQIITMEYHRLKAPHRITRRIRPVGIMFSEYYFYLIAFPDEPTVDLRAINPEELRPTIFRIDRIRSFTVENEHFRVPYHNRFEEGEFRKRVQFMFGGKLKEIRFRYTGLSLEAVLDRLPTAKVLKQDETGYILSAEVYGNGVDMWLKGQSDQIEVL